MLSLGKTFQQWLGIWFNPKMFGTLSAGLCLLSFNSCGATDIGPDPREQKIYDIKWSPDGHQLAFTYQNGAASTRNFILYTVQEDGSQSKELLQSYTQNGHYLLLKWASANKLLTADDQHVYEVNLQGESRMLFSAVQYAFLCAFSEGRVLAIDQTAKLLLLDTSETQAGKTPSMELIPPHPFTGHNTFFNSFICSLSGSSAYIASLYYDPKTSIESNVFATADILPEARKIQNFRTFDPFKFRPEQEKGYPKYQVLGWKNEHTLVYAFVPDSPPILIYEYDVTTGETRQNQEIKVLGEFSPDFQKVAYITYFDKSDYLTVSRPDGTGVKRLLRVNTLPKGNLPI